MATTLTGIGRRTRVGALDANAALSPKPRHAAPSPPHAMRA